MRRLRNPALVRGSEVEEPTEGPAGTAGDRVEGFELLRGGPEEGEGEGWPREEAAEHWGSEGGAVCRWGLGVDRRAVE